MTPLCELAKKYGSDKGGAHINSPPGYHDTCHNYTPFYHELFKDKREQVRWVLEIGIGHGCSLRMWRDYFPQAQIIGIDSNNECMLIADRIRTFIADQYDEQNLIAIMDHLVITDHISPIQFDLIIDDGSHEPAHQIFTAQVLLQYLAPDGIYVIEDIEPDCQPQLIGNPIVNGLNERATPVSTHKDFVWNPIPTGRGLGRAHCRCGCETGEQLVVLRHAPRRASPFRYVQA